MKDQTKIKFPKKKPTWWKELYKTGEKVQESTTTPKWPSVQNKAPQGTNSSG